MSETQGPASAALGTSTVWHALSVEEALEKQTVEPAIGLTSAEVEARRSTYGPNMFAT